MGGLTADQLAAIKLLADALAPQEPNWKDGLDAFFGFMEHIAWPVVAVTALVLFRRPLGRIASLSYGEFKLDIGRELERVERAAGKQEAAERRSGPTALEAQAAREVDRLTTAASLGEVRNAGISLAAEYDRIRATMTSGPTRVQVMEGIVAKMRALAWALIPLRQEFMASPIPGWRLVAVSSLQLAPDYEALAWLVERIKSEKPFIGYHAALALRAAALDSSAPANRKSLCSAKALLRAAEIDLPPDSDRSSVLQQFKSIVETLHAC